MATLVNPSWFWVKFFGYLTLVCLVGPSLFWLIGWAAFVVAVGIGGSLALGWGFSTMFLAWQARKIDRRLQALPTRALVHWTYSSPLWNKFADRVENEADHYPWQSALLGTGIGFLVGLGIGWGLTEAWEAHPFGQGKWYGKANIVLISLVAGTLGLGCLGWLFGVWGRYMARAKAKRMRTQPGEAYIGPDEAYCNEDYINWWQWEAVLQSASIECEGELLLLVLATSKGSGRSRFAQMLELPIPEGCEKQAREICSKLSKS